MSSKSRINVSFVGFMVFVYQGLFSLSIVLGNIVYLFLHREFKDLLEVIVNVPTLLLSFTIIYSYVTGLRFRTIHDMPLYIIKMVLLAPFISASIVTGAVSLYLMINYYMTTDLVYSAWSLRFILISIAFSSISVLVSYLRGADETL